MKVIIEREIESWWGADEYVTDMIADSKTTDEIERALIELFQEDLTALLDGASWEIVMDEDGPSKLDAMCPMPDMSALTIRQKEADDAK